MVWFPLILKIKPYFFSSESWDVTFFKSHRADFPQRCDIRGFLTIFTFRRLLTIVTCLNNGRIDMIFLPACRTGINRYFEYQHHESSTRKKISATFWEKKIQFLFLLKIDFSTFSKCRKKSIFRRKIVETFFQNVAENFFSSKSHDVGIQNIRSTSKNVPVKKLGSSDE